MFLSYAGLAVLNLPLSGTSFRYLVRVSQAHDAYPNRRQPGIWTRMGCRNPGTWFYRCATHVKTFNSVGTYAGGRLRTAQAKKKPTRVAEMLDVVTFNRSDVIR